jgi:histone chaperone ASF1
VEANLRRLCSVVSLDHSSAIAVLTVHLLRSEHDQELDSLSVGPVPMGTNKFVFEADPPNTANIPSSEIIGVTVILLTCSYDGREFVRVGYYVNNEYTDETLAENPPSKPVIEKIRRNILAEKPRVTRFAIKWYVKICVDPR